MQNPSLAMMPSDGYVRQQVRRVFTGLCFILFGLGSLDLALLVFPVILVFARGRNQRRRAIQTVISWHFRLFLKILRFLGIMTLQTENIERLKSDKGTLIIANHPTLLDVVVLIAFLPEVDCVVKEGLNRNLFLRGVVRAAGYITNSNSDSLLTGCHDSLSQGRNLIIFPEGTRSVSGQPYRFQRGVAHVALRAGCRVRPVYLTCEPETLSKEHKWYDVPDRPFAFRVQVGELIDAAAWRNDQALSIETRRFTHYLEQHYRDTFPQQARPDRLKSGVA